jgi:cysteine-rich repeat protein
MKKRNKSNPKKKSSPILIAAITLIALLILLIIYASSDRFLLSVAAAQCNDGIDNDGDDKIDAGGPPPTRDKTCRNNGNYDDECFVAGDSTISGTPLFRFSGDIDGHASTYSTIGYPYTSCLNTMPSLQNNVNTCKCPDINNPLTAGRPAILCSDPNADTSSGPANLVVRLSSNDNAHAEKKTSSAYIGTGVDVCMGSLVCEYREGSCDTVNLEECVGSLSEGDTNLHVGQCSKYTTKICCRDTSASCQGCRPSQSNAAGIGAGDLIVIDTDTDREGFQMDIGDVLPLSINERNLIPGHDSWKWTRTITLSNEGSATSSSNSEDVLSSGGAENPGEIEVTLDTLGFHSYSLVLTYAGHDLRYDSRIIEVIPPPVCGNNLLELNRLEICDCGPDNECGTADDLLNGVSCNDFNFIGGTLSCGGVDTEYEKACQYFDLSACLGCGDGILNYQEECDDSNQRNGDGCSSECKITQVCEYTPETGIDDNNVYGLKPEDTVSIGDRFLTLKDITGSNTIIIDVGDSNSGEIIEKNVQVTRGSWITTEQMTLKATQINFISSGFPTNEAEIDVVGNVCGPSCGNNVKEKYQEYVEECDDGNIINGDGCENTCTFSPVASVPSPPLQETAIIPKNRYISFIPQNSGKQTALRVTLKTLPLGFEAFEDRTVWVSSPKDICETSSVSEGDCVLSKFKAAQLQTGTQCSTPYYADWGTLGLVNIFGSEIVPNSVYEIQVIEEGCNPDNPNCYSAPIEVKTGKFGKILPDNENANPLTWNGQVQIADALETIKAFSNSPDKLTKARTEIEYEVIDNMANIGDTVQVLKAFSGLSYSSHQGITNCGETISSQFASTPLSINTQQDVDSAVRNANPSYPSTANSIISATIIDGEVYGTADICGKVHNVNTNTGAVTISSQQSQTSSCTTPVSKIKKFFGF